MSVAALLDDYLDGLLAADASAPVAALPAATAAPAAPAAAPIPLAPPAAAVTDARAAPTAAAATPAPHAPPVPAAPSSVPAAPRPQPASTLPPPALPRPRAGDAAAAADTPARRAADRSSRWLRLRCVDQLYGLELLKVQEVVLPVPLLPLRGTAAAMLGVMNLRGQVVPVLDLGMYLGKPADATTPATRFVVLEEKGEVLGLRVSAVEDVVTLGADQVEAPGVTRVRRSDDGLFRGIARQGGAPVVLLDASCLLVPPGHGDHG